MTLSIRSRIALGNAFLVALTLLVFALLVRFLTQRMLLATLDKTLAGQALSALPPPPRSFDLPEGGPGWPSLRPPDHRRPREDDGTSILLPPRRIVLDAPRLAPAHSVLGLDEARTADRPNYQNDDLNGRSIRVYSLPIHDRQGHLFLVVQTAAFLSEIESALLGLDQALLLLSPVMILVALGGGKLLTGRALAPVRALTEAAAGMQASSLTERLPEPGGGDELDILSQQLNRMLARLEAAFVRQKRFTADASHELRTPLAVIKATTSLLLDDPTTLLPGQCEALSGADEAADRATRLVSDLLLLARTENGSLPVRRTDVALEQTIKAAVQEAEVGQSGERAPVVLDLAPGLFSSDRDLLIRLVANLVGNALRHTPREGQVTVASRIAAGCLELTVVDTGEGIAPEHLSRLGEPFYRPDASRARAQGGAGLGLTLCRGIVDVLGGTLSIESEVGKGTRVQINLPPLPPPV